MKNLRTNLLTGLFFLVSTFAFSQGKIKGIVVDNELNGTLPGVNVVVKGSTTGTTTDSDGKFIINSSSASGQIVLTYIGFKSQTVNFTVKNGETIDLGTLKLASDSNQLEEVVVVGKGVIDLIKDRQTPIAVSNIKAADIQAKIGTADITQAMVNTPSVYVAGQSGGYGDSRITVRGFQQDNTAFLLNGQPINGMEDGKMYWSNWSGMADIANVIQIQRGLGSSKLAISSVGGTVNFVTKATEKKEGGFASFGIANNDYFKSTVGYNSGMSKKGWGVSLMLSHWQGNGFNEGTRGEGQNYFISVGYKPSDKHNFNFLITGAPQYHDQNFSKKITDYLGYGRTYNNNYGYLNGQYLSERTNFYHKPVANFNWDYDISSKTQLSTVLYASVGRGGGTGNYGASAGKKYITTTNPHTGWTGERTYIDYTTIYNLNLTDADGIGAGNNNDNYVIRASMNNHAWYGVVSNLKTKLTDKLNLNFGVDLRSYEGTHYRQVVDYLGLNSWTESRKLFNQNHINNLPSSITASNTVTDYQVAEPWTSMFNTIGEDQRIDYDYSETISYGGVFGQLEYSTDKLSAFVQGAVSNQSHQRTDRYDYEPQYADSEKVDNLGYNVKAGGSYRITEKNSVYINAGFYSRQPYHDNVYLNFTNRVNPLTSNEDVLGFEAGYSFKSKLFSANLNLYRTSWKNRVITTSRNVTTATETIGTTVLNQGDLVYTSSQTDEQLHQGIELDFVLKPTTKLNFNAFASVGNWEYVGNSNQRKYDEGQNLLDEVKTDVDGGKVGDAAQTTWGLGAKYEIFERFSVDADWRNYDNLFSNVAATKDNLELPTYDLVDFGISYKMLVGSKKLNSLIFRVNISNLFDEVYLSELNSALKIATEDEFINHTGNGLINPSGSTTNSSNFLQGGTGTTLNKYATYQDYLNKGTYNGIDARNQGYFGQGRTWSVSLKYSF